jgi:hypothetical protein
MKTNYHIRTNPVVHGSKITHTPNGTAILVNMITRGIKYNCIKKKRNG